MKMNSRVKLPFDTGQVSTFDGQKELLFLERQRFWQNGHLHLSARLGLDAALLTTESINKGHFDVKVSSEEWTLDYIN